MVKDYSSNCFHFLRLLFALTVVIGHFIGISHLDDIQYLRPYFNTYYAVTGFFVISGFLITQSYLKTHDIKFYFKKRANRLLPAYMTVVIGCAFLFVFVSDYSVVQYFTHPMWRKYLFANMGFLNFIQPCLPGVFNNDFLDCPVNPSLWTIKIEVGFYIVLPLLIYLLIKLKHRYIGLITIYLFAVIYRNLLNWYGNINEIDMAIFLARQLPGFMSYFSVGMMFCLYKNLFLKYKNYIIIPAIVIFIIERYFEVEYFLPLAYGTMVVWAAYSLKCFNNLGRFGDISYGIYIYHAPLLKLLMTVGLLSTINAYCTLGLYLILVMLVGAISWHCMEKHFLNRK